MACTEQSMVPPHVARRTLWGACMVVEGARHDMRSQSAMAVVWQVNLLEEQLVWAPMGPPSAAVPSASAPRWG